jgi:hypothetical protein
MYSRSKAVTSRSPTAQVRLGRCLDARTDAGAADVVREMMVSGTGVSLQVRCAAGKYPRVLHFHLLVFGDVYGLNLLAVYEVRPPA